MKNTLLALALLSLSTVARTPAQDLEQLESELRAAETAFARTVADKDFDAFRSMLHDTATFGGGGQLLRGPDQVAAAWKAAFFGPGSTTLKWRPETVFVSTDGDIGLSTGPYESTGRGPSGEEVTVDGVFFSVWRRVGDEWKIVLDGGTPGQPRETP